MSATVSEIISMMEELAPSSLAEDWDNVGLQVGRTDRTVTRIHIALDPTPEVVAKACDDGAEMLITHHPLIFAPLKNLDLATPLGEIIARSVSSSLAIYSAHTNLDSAPDGLNDAFSRMIGIDPSGPLVPSVDSETVKLVFFVPEEYRHKVMKALFSGGAGAIGKYSCCSFSSAGRGTYMPSGDAEPFEGSAGKMSCVDEVRVEAVVKRSRLDHVLSVVREVHPYETMEYNIYPLLRTADADASGAGLGRVGALAAPMTLAELAQRVKEVLGLPAVKMVGDPGMTIRRAAVCTGSGASLMKAFYRSGADVYVSGELKYHDAHTVLEKGKGLVDAGHFGTEHFACGLLARALKEKIRERGLAVEVVASDIEKDPFAFV
ncbi:Nif3-like dinuclear metal center hexameric protein [Desulfoluna spongiiphila]|uniref:Nif3-like dinuclear metal center hexameric protein n=1 Tax=Desulfoluna spongiiphila TaxID=419481 RepID=UPI001258E123|nr:Nif3-like dinuclear metal center hexameric protein [Desulfoluna spongiiphila]VVS94381.1 gtp cyclohydrolase 1 type 2//nif3 bacteria [Desulfoluna spongiiphila]